MLENVASLDRARAPYSDFHIIVKFVKIWFLKQCWLLCKSSTQVNTTLLRFLVSEGNTLIYGIKSQLRSQLSCSSDLLISFQCVNKIWPCNMFKQSCQQKGFIILKPSRKGK